MKKLTLSTVKSRTGCDDLENLKKLDIWGKDIVDISLVS